MFERFTERARQVMVFAQEEARVLRHNYIGTEHLLLGVLRVENGLAARALRSLSIGLEDVRDQVARIVGQGDEITGGQIPFTPRAKKVLELSLSEARERRDSYIGTEHLLLGLVREGEGVAMRILLDRGAHADRIRNEVNRMLQGPERRIEADDVVPSTSLDLMIEPSTSAESSILPSVFADRPNAVLVAGTLMAAVGFPVGLLVGWLIWG